MGVVCVIILSRHGRGVCDYIESPWAWCVIIMSRHGRGVCDYIESPWAWCV